jgi:hypothetical protein
MPGRRGLYRIFVMNLAGQDSNNQWNSDAFNDVGNRLQAHFQRVVAHPACPFTSIAWYPGHAGMTLAPGELLVYFVASSSDSVVTAAGGQLTDLNPGGVTWASPTGMISEVWLRGSPLHPNAAPLSDPNYQQLLANLAFHELMHNKLDASNTGAVLDDIHFQGGGGLASATVNANSHLTPQNIALMAPNLARPIPQYTAAANVSMVLMDGMPQFIEGKQAPTP